MKINNKKSDPVKRYLKIDYQVFQTKNVALGAKILWAHFNSFGKKGCFQSDEQLSKEISVSLRSISSWISQLKKANGIIVKSSKSRYRTIWTNEQYKKWFKTEDTRQSSTPQNMRTTSQNLQITSQNHAFNSAKSDTFTSQNMRTTINILKRINENEIATPSSLPAVGQASVLLEDNENEKIISIENFNQTIKESVQPQKLTATEIERRKEEQKKLLCD